MSARITVTSEGIVEHELVVAVHHLVPVGEHAGGKGNLLGIQIVELQIFQGLISLANIFGDFK